MNGSAPRSSASRPGGAARGARADGGGGANRRMFASIQSTLSGGRSSRPFDGGTTGLARPTEQRGTPRRREHTPVILKSVDDVIGQLADLERRGEHSTSQIKQNLEASSATLDEMWDEEWAKLVDVLMKMCLESDEAVFVVELLPIFMKYGDFLEAFRERLIASASEFVLPSVEEGEGAGESEAQRRLEQIPAFLGSLLCARWPRGMHRDTHESNPVLFTAFEIVRGWLLVVQEATVVEGRDKEKEEASRRQYPVEECEFPTSDDDDIASALQDGCRIEGEDAAAAGAADTDPEDEDEEPPTTSPALLNACCAALAALCESQQRSLWLSRPELVDDMYKCIKVAITHNRDIEGSVKSSLLHTYLLMNEWTRSRAVTTKCAATQTAAC